MRKETGLKLTAGQLLARGVCRHLLSYDYVSLLEFIPKTGRRVDVIGLGPKGEIWIVECKSSVVDFQSDHKWQDYLEWCDRYFWAVDKNFPIELLPSESGLIIADPYDAEIIHMPQEERLNSSRRKAMILKIARHAARREQKKRDPGIRKFK